MSTPDSLSPSSQALTLQSIIDAWPQPFILVDTAGALAASNEAARELWSPTLGGAVGLPLADVLPELAAVWSEERPALHTASPALGNPDVASHVTVKGRTWTVQVRPLGDGLGAAFSPVEDHAARLQGQLDDARREFDALVHAVSHDLRAPVRHLSSFSALLRQHHARSDTPDERAARFTEVIGEASLKLGRMIEGLMAFARAGTAPYHAVPVDLGHVLDRAKRAAERDLGGAALHWSAAPLPVIVGDEELLVQAFTQVLSNAVKFSRAQSAVRIDITAERRADQVIMGIHDQGVGFDPKYAARLFTVFQRLHREVDFAGEGVGLATVRRIVERHGGQVWAQGQPGEGASVFVSLPLAR